MNDMIHVFVVFTSFWSIIWDVFAWYQHTVVMSIIPSASADVRPLSLLISTGRWSFKILFGLKEIYYWHVEPGCVLLVLNCRVCLPRVTSVWCICVAAGLTGVSAYSKALCEQACTWSTEASSANFTSYQLTSFNVLRHWKHAGRPHDLSHWKIVRLDGFFKKIQWSHSHMIVPPVPSSNLASCPQQHSIHLLLHFSIVFLWSIFHPSN